jgi:hypothetical protein
VKSREPLDCHQPPRRVSLCDLRSPKARSRFCCGRKCRSMSRLPQRRGNLMRNHFSTSCRPSSRGIKCHRNGPIRRLLTSGIVSHLCDSARERIIDGMSARWLLSRRPQSRFESLFVDKLIRHEAIFGIKYSLGSRFLRRSPSLTVVCYPGSGQGIEREKQIK